MTQLNVFTDGFLNYSNERITDNLAQIERCVELLSVEQIWHRPNEVSNAIGNLVIHLAGNVRQWIVAGLGGESDQRDRPSEFAQREAIPKDEMIGRLKSAVDDAIAVIGGLSVEALIEPIKIQGYDVTGWKAVYHVTEHFSLHTGQIVYATKIILNRDLSLYDADGNRIDGRDSGTP